MVSQLATLVQLRGFYGGAKADLSKGRPGHPAATRCADELLGVRDGPGRGLVEPRPGDASLIDLRAGARLHRHLVDGTVNTGGSNYTSTPTITPTPANQRGAYTAVRTGGQVTGITAAWPGWYDVAPTLAITAGGGAGATATANLSAVPTFSATSMMMGDTIAAGLASEAQDIATGFECAVVRWPAAGSKGRVVLGSLTANGSFGAGVVFLADGTLRFLTQPGTIDDFARPQGVAVGDLVFVAHGYDGTSRIAFLGGATPIVRALTKPAHPSLGTTGVGNVGWQNPLWSDAVEVTAYAKAPPLTVADVVNIYGLVRQRHFARSLVVRG